MTADDFRQIALGMQGAIERAHMRHPDFRANGRIFASLHANDASGTVKLSPEEQGEFMRLYPKVFAAASGAWGRQGWTTVRLAAADEAAVRGAVTLAWQGVAEKPRKRRPSKPATNQRTRPSRKRRT